MNSIAPWLGATGLAIIAAMYPHEIRANEFTGSEFLKWSEAQQLSYINAQLVMASSIVARDKPVMSQCVSDTFFGEALLKRLSELDHASSSYVVFYKKRYGRFFVSTGHTYDSLLKPETLIGAHCYVFADVAGAGSRQIDLGRMSKSKKLTLPSYRAAALRGTGISEADVGKMQALCQWPEGAA